MCGEGQLLRLMFEHGRDLLVRHPRKPLQKFDDRRPIAKVLEQRTNWHASPAKYPRPTDHVGMAFDGKTSAPVVHDSHYYQ